jgi:hypothetical protein
MKKYFKSTEHYIRFDKTSGELLSIFNNLDVVSTQLIPLSQVDKMTSILSLSVLNTEIDELEFNEKLNLLKDKIKNL